MKIHSRVLKTRFYLSIIFIEDGKYQKNEKEEEFIMRKSLLLVVVLLAMASLMAAMALTRAEINNGMKFSVVSTDEAKVSVKPNTDDHTGVAYIEDNKMVLDFSRGMQPGSKYTYKNLFTIENKTEKTIYVGLRFDSCYKNQENAEKNFPNGLHTVYASKNLVKPIKLSIICCLKNKFFY